MNNNLQENSHAYYEQTDVYELFSEAEDFPKLINVHLLEHLKEKEVLDLGCGNGKYINVLKPYVKSIIGADKSYEQLIKAKKYTENLVQCDCTYLPFKEKSFDAVLSCWMLGTLAEKSRQIQALNEMKRVIRPGGSIIFVENAAQGQFEEIRGRNPKVNPATQQYNDFLISQGFEIIKEVKTYFRFENIDLCHHVFNEIWRDRLTSPIISSTIEHDVIILVLRNM